MPQFSSSPKLDTAAGVLAAYVTRLDERSRPSMFGASAKYTTSDSLVAALFAKTSFDEDRQRLNVYSFLGNINNEYENYLGTGEPAETEDRYRGIFGRYLYRVHGDWFLGAQAVYSDYDLSGKTAETNEAMRETGVTGFTSGGLGAVLVHDSRDSEYKPGKGWYLGINNMAYREALGGEQDFDVYRVDFRYFVTHDNGNVFALRQRNQFSHNAPTGALSTIRLRGYTQGEYLAQNMSSIELEERLRINERWTATAFAGIACLYGDGPDGSSRSCSEGDNRFPSGGVGVQYLLKPEAGLVANLEYAVGKDDNSGLYLKMGYAF
ncbi:BamA/TamA family outer membrane protein [Jeongeupia naejangsanensis]